MIVRHVLFLLIIATSALSYAQERNKPVPPISGQTQDGNSHKKDAESNKAAPANLGYRLYGNADRATQIGRSNQQSANEESTEWTKPSTLIALFAGIFSLLVYLANRNLVEITREASQRQLRAYVFVQRFPWTSHINDQDRDKSWWDIAPIWENAGQTPTIGLSINVNSSVMDGPLPDGFDFPDAMIDYNTPVVLGPKGTTGSSLVGISSADLLAVSKGDKWFYIWGWAKYRDAFADTPQRITKFCVRVTFLGDPYKRIGDGNICEMHFRNYPKNNCADDECQQQ